MEIVIKNIPELEQFAQQFLRGLTTTETHAIVVGLSGDLGSGKTAFTKGVAKALGITEEILSPTFVIAKFYAIPKHPVWSRLVHVDAYRIEDSAELKILRWEELLRDPHNLILIEWPEHIGALFPDGATTLRFRFVDETTRAVSASS